MILLKIHFPKNFGCKINLFDFKFQNLLLKKVFLFYKTFIFENSFLYICLFI